MKRILWLTDIHLNFLDAGTRTRFLASVRDQVADVVLLGGDIGEAPSVGAYLEEMANILACPVYFVLGNHDFYEGSLAEVRAQVGGLASRVSNLTYLTQADVVGLTANTALIGHDSWADGRLGNFDMSEVMLTDYLEIRDLIGLEEVVLQKKLNALGDEAAAYFKAAVDLALQRHQRVVALTHVPPFRESCWHEGRISSDVWLPHFSCKASGDVLREAMENRRDRDMLVLCGHTHSGGEAQVLQNLTVLTGQAEYGEPAIQRVFDID